MKKNRIRICGRKVTTAPTPAIAPSTMSERKQAGGKRVLATWPTARRRRSSIQPTGAWLHANTAWNMTNMMAARMIGPAIG